MLGSAGQGPGAADQGRAASPWWLALACAATVAPLAAARWFPGLDLPAHTAVVAQQDYLGYLVQADPSWSYLTFYVVARALAGVIGDPAVAIQLVIAGYVVAFAFAARALLRAYGVSPALALLAPPAALSVVMAYGFLPFAVGYPLVLWLWSECRRAARAPSGVGLVTVLLLSLLAALTHPLIAALGAAGGVIVALTSARWEASRRASLVVLALVVGLWPAVLAAAAANDGAAHASALLREASVWERLVNAPRLPLADALVLTPRWLLGCYEAGFRAWLAGGLVLAGLLAVILGGRVRRAQGPWSRRLAPELLFAALALAYLAAPWQLDAPLVFAVQPRVLPLLWIAFLLCLGLRPRAARPAATGAVLLCAAAAGAILWAVSFAAFAAEARHFARVVDASAPGARTLTLIEQPAAPEREPASPWRHAGVWLMADRGGVASHAFFSDAGWLPLRRAPSTRLPPAPPPSQPHTFDCAAHTAGWDQLLVRGLGELEIEPCPDAVLRATSGAWRLYALPAPVRGRP